MSSYFSSTNSTVASSDYYYRKYRTDYGVDPFEKVAQKEEDAFSMRLNEMTKKIKKIREDTEKRNEVHLFDVMELDIDNIQEMLS